MTVQEQKQIAIAFSDKFQEFDLDLKLTADEFRLFDNGISANSMDEKWNILVLDNFMCWTRSWTDNLIYIIQLKRQSDTVILEKGFVTRDETRYMSEGIEEDKTIFLQLLQFYLDRDDIYVDPEFQLDVIKKIIKKFDPAGKCKKSIGHTDVGETKKIYEALTQEDLKAYYSVFGWNELKQHLSNRDDNEPLLSLHLLGGQTNSSVAYYFDKEVKSLLGQIVLKTKLTNS
ncbi:hypothetical protein [Hymenobacter baengnokdamensis]|uniref:hypothetical protein n=1 Tax=Hymenobacter baengnokdamensis TaxID=2615203 RepID=UPI00124472C3|nr:hypothetical protein [Hymenobacter baengnokdamensis]